MAIFHLQVNTVKRSAGRSAVAAAAYRAGVRLYDQRVGEIADYRRRRGVGATFIALPKDAPEWADDRDQLWNQVEASETRKNSTVAREWMVALPTELDDAGRKALVQALSGHLVERYGVAVDCAIHPPDRKGDTRNHHAHLLTSTRALSAEGFGAKTRVLDAAKTGGVEIEAVRAWWADACNDALEAAGRREKVDPRAKSLQAADAIARAQRVAKEAETLEIVNGSVHSLSEARRGLGTALRHPAAVFARNGVQKAEERRIEAQAAQREADRLSEPIGRHRGPAGTAVERRRAAERAEAAERRRIEQEEVRQRREATQRAAEEERARQRVRDEYAEVTLPLVQRARQDASFAWRIERWGIDLDRPDAEVARDDTWRAAGEGYEGKMVWAIVRDDARALDRKAEAETARRQAEAEARRKEAVTAFTARQAERADSFPTPRQRWPHPRFQALDPESLQSSFASKHRERLTAGEITEAIRGAVTRWVARIVEDMPAFQRGRSSVWLALTGGNGDAAASLRQSIADHPDLGRPLQDALDRHDPPQEPEPPAPSNNGPSM